MKSIKKIFIRNFGKSSLLFFTSLLLFILNPTKVEAKPRRIAIFVNGYQDCCAIEMAETKRAFNDMDIEWFDNAWDSVFPISRVKHQLNHGEITTVGSNRFKNQMAQYLSSLPEGTEIFLIGHSFGGDSILHFLDSYSNHRTRGQGAVKIRLAAVIDPVGYAGTRANALSNSVGSNVEYFFNRWQTNNVPPIDYVNSNGRIRSCKAKVCDEKEHSTARNRDGSARRVNCGKLEVGCDGAKWIWEGTSSRWFPGRKNEPRRHNDMPADDFIEAQIINIVRDQIAISNQPVIKNVEGKKYCPDGAFARELVSKANQTFGIRCYKANVNGIHTKVNKREFWTRQFIQLDSNGKLQSLQGASCPKNRFVDEIVFNENNNTISIRCRYVLAQLGSNTYRGSWSSDYWSLKFTNNDASQIDWKQCPNTSVISEVVQKPNGLYIRCRQVIVNSSPLKFDVGHWTRFFGNRK